VAARAEFLREFNTTDLSDMADVHGIMRDVLACNVCPSNGAVARKVRQRYGEEVGRQLVFNLSFRNFPTPAQALCGNNSSCVSVDRYGVEFTTPVRNDLFYNQFAPPAPFANFQSKFKDCNCGNHQSVRFSPFDAGSEGWGDDLSHQYIIEDMLKLSPAQILYLKTTKPRKAELFAWLAKSGMGSEWFDNYADTWCESVGGVLCERGVMDLDKVLIGGGITIARAEFE